MKITLTQQEYNHLCQQDPSTEKDGGYQSLMVSLQRRTNPSTLEIDLTDDDLEKIPRYAFKYNQGGWQDRLMAIFSRSLGPDLEVKKF
ncbi:MAG: aspartyl-tRNA synthetase [Verrucomicrobiales bacterium]|nr:aspartyl-tRNA synthetase [Verrucomicrobiae bacterium]